MGFSNPYLVETQEIREWREGKKEEDMGRSAVELDVGIFSQLNKELVTIWATDCSYLLFICKKGFGKS